MIKIFMLLTWLIVGAEAKSGACDRFYKQAEKYSIMMDKSDDLNLSISEIKDLSSIVDSATRSFEVCKRREVEKEKEKDMEELKTKYENTKKVMSDYYQKIYDNYEIVKKSYIDSNNTD